MLEKLIDEQQLLDKLDPAILIGPRFGLWPKTRRSSMSAPWPTTSRN